MKEILKEIVSQRLSAAPDSTAKSELIEELAENLYCRYNDMVQNGVEAEEARARAVDALGDTDELVEYLKSLEPNQPLPELVLDPDKPDGGQIEEILQNVEGILRGAFHKARSAFKEAKDSVKEGFEAEVSAKVHVHSGEKDLSELEKKMNQAEKDMEEKQSQLEEAQEALSELESARDALEAVTDQTIVADALADIEVKIGAKEAEIQRLEEEHDALEEEFDRLEEEFDSLEEELDQLDDAGLEDLEDMEDMEDDEVSDKGWKVTYQSKNHSVEFNSDEIKSSMKDMMKDIEKVIRDATGVAKDACKKAKEATEKACGDISAVCTPDAVVEADQPIDAAQLNAIDVQTFGGDITVRMTQAADGDVLVGGDIDDIEVFRSADGVLTIRPVKTETSAFFFGRGVFNSGSSADVVLDLPCRAWKNLKLSTTNGDVEVSGDNPVDGVSVASVSGDIRCRLPSCAKVTCRTTNGDIHWTGDASEFRMESISGDVEFRGSADSVHAKTTSGDLTIEGGICAVSVKSISGDVCLRSSVLPDRVDIGTTSGDMWVDIPDAGAFSARFRSTSGDFTSDFFTGRMGGRNCVFNYQGGGERVYTFASISGDVEIRKYR